MVISRHEVDYRLPLLPTVHPVRVETWVTEARAASFKLAYEVRDDENVYVTATSTLVAFDVEAAWPAPLHPAGARVHRPLHGTRGLTVPAASRSVS